MTAAYPGSLALAAVAVGIVAVCSISVGALLGSGSGGVAFRLQASFFEEEGETGSCGPLTITIGLEGNATGGFAQYRFVWSFGPGTPIGYGQNTTHTYTSWGTFYVTLLIVDGYGEIASATHSVSASPPPCGPPL